MELVGLKDTAKTVVTGVEMFKKLLDRGEAGDNIEFEVTLITPIAIEHQLRFAIREGGRTVGAGVVSEIIE